MRKRIDDEVKSHPVVLYMKGTPQFPQCGFSALAVEALMRHLPSKEDLHAVNVLMDPDVRQGIKEYSSWPTIPQLYVNGNFIGGSDIIKQMHDDGELGTLLKSAPEQQAQSS